MIIHEKNLSRRAALRLLGAAGLGFMGGGALAVLRGTPAASYFLLTGEPDRDLALLRRAAGLMSAHMRVDLWPVPRAAQDLTLVRDGAILDPVAPGAGAAVRDLALRVRARHEPATMLLAVSGPARGDAATVLVARDGVVWDRLDANRRYDRIEVPVAQGTAVLRLVDRRLSVVEAPCRHRLCQKMSEGGAGRIICAPNRLLATVGVGAMVDGVSG